MSASEKNRPSGAPEARKSLPPDGRERRSYERVPVDWSVDYQSGDTFLFSYITNISAMGIFVYSEKPLPVGSEITLKFAPPGETPLELRGEVTWVNPFREGGENLNPGMGVRFVDLEPPVRERLVELVRTIAYLPDDASGSAGNTPHGSG
jgi:type IV pilus assembly protein PilZ